ncbi:MAG: S9 family peptidase, partial [Deltaproteobacteria bacterium HGW-Deltaproteobacteria-20]
PYHNVKEGTAYPATLITAAEGDSRVHPFHARKMTAALQYATASDEPILARIESKAGHGAGKPVTKRVQEYTDVYAFLMWKLGMLSR